MACFIGLSGLGARSTAALVAFGHGPAAGVIILVLGNMAMTPQSQCAMLGTMATTWQYASDMATWEWHGNDVAISWQ